MTRQSPPPDSFEDDVPVQGAGRYPLVMGILAVNTVLYLVMALSDGAFDLSTQTMLDFGALVPRDYIDGQYWRLFSYGFLHASVVHILANSVCLIAWGVPLENALGARRLALLYGGSILLGGLGSFFMQANPAVTVGASGGISGLLGALFLLFLLRLIDLPKSFFLINIGLNIAVPFLVPGIDWQAHLFGFFGGMLLQFALLRLHVPRAP